MEEEEESDPHRHTTEENVVETLIKASSNPEKDLTLYVEIASVTLHSI